MTPRRSSRARITQPSPALLQHANSSGSSQSMARERSTRSNNKGPSPQGSSSHRSQSIDDGESGSKNDLPHTRQRQRARDDEDPDPPREEDEDDPEEDEEEEITRCLCGQQDYPGLPPSRREALGRGVKPESGNPPTNSSDLMSDDIGSMFIQCDSCKVWQHGGCVGIMDEDMSPDEYFCEECRKDLHKIWGESNGQRSSTYLPVAPALSPAPSSRASSQDTSRRSKDPNARYSEGAASNMKRRSTMNSRDAAYDEEEQLRRAIEESKEGNTSSPEEATTRRGKRSRSDSEANRQGTKRQRTASPSPDPASKPSNSASQSPSDDESKTKSTANGTRRQRAASRGQKEMAKELEEAETEAQRRIERSNRRKGDESENESGSPVKAVPNEPEPSQASPITPTPQEPTPARQFTRKSGRPGARRGGRVGRNQYTKDRDVNGTGTESANSPRRDQSHDMGGDSPRVGNAGPNGAHINGGESGRPSKPRHIHPQRTTMNEMKRRVAAILEFISRMQVEMAVASENSSATPTGNGDRPNGLLLKSMVDQIENAMPLTTSEGDESGPATTDGDGDAPTREKNFKDLSSVEMMDVLTRHLLKWQQEYGKFGER